MANKGSGGEAAYHTLWRRFQRRRHVDGIGWIALRLDLLLTEAMAQREKAMAESSLVRDERIVYAMELTTIDDDGAERVLGNRIRHTRTELE